MDLEEQLQEQLQEQQEALAGVKELLEADPDSEEMAALLDELQTGTCLFHSPAALHHLPCMFVIKQLSRPRWHTCRDSRH